MVAISFFLLFIVGDAANVARENVDLVELNHFHDVAGRPVYSQIIFYEWAPDASRYYVRAWVLATETNQPTRDYRTGFCRVRYFDADQKLRREITAGSYRETWSQVDPERANKSLLDERARRALIKRTPAPVVAGEPDETEQTPPP
jgi:hypothetical protein